MMSVSRRPSSWRGAVERSGFPERRVAQRVQAFSSGPGEIMMRLLVVGAGSTASRAPTVTQSSVQKS